MFAYVLIQLLLKQNIKQIFSTHNFLILRGFLHWVVQHTTQSVKVCQKPFLCGFSECFVRSLIITS